MLFRSAIPNGSGRRKDSGGSGRILGHGPPFRSAIGGGGDSPMGVSRQKSGREFDCKAVEVVGQPYRKGGKGVRVVFEDGHGIPSVL